MTLKQQEQIDSMELTPAVQSAYFNRELSWIEFNRRVLAEALDARNPLLERVKFLSIFASNLDEFFMIRVSGIKQQIAARVQKRSPDGLTPTEQLTAIRRTLLPLLDEQRHLFLHELIPALAGQGIHLLNYDDLNDAQRAFVTGYFEHQVFPVLTPLGFDVSRPFPHISNLSLNLAVVIHDDEEGELFARVKVPEVLPRLVALPSELGTLSDDVPPERRYYFVWLEQIIMAHISALFPGMHVVEVHPFRVVRNADMEIVEDEADDLLYTIEQSLRQRRFGQVVCVKIDSDMPDHTQQILLANLKVEPSDVYTVRGPLGLTDTMSLHKLDRPDLKSPPHYPRVPPLLRGQTDIFAAIRQHDILLHHPYDSFSPIVDFIQAAADDPDVLAIKQTLYRVGSNSPIVMALMHAREAGKQVTVLVELKARFDEENNIIWARALERAGVHVVYGLPRLKTHAKLALVVRKENDVIRRYVHMGTGNYNASTARLYTDLSFLTCRPDLGADVSELFNSLTGYSRQRHYRKLLVAPVGLREHMLELIHRETRLHQEYGNGRMIFKMNSLVDIQIIKALYQAAQAGVQIDLIIRGICRLKPGVPDLSETIRVRSIIGPFLEHSRIYYFYNNGQEQVYLGSADMMERNLDRRVEQIFPLEEPKLRQYVRDKLLETYLRDNLRAWILHPDGHYTRITPQDGQPVVDSQCIKLMKGCDLLE